MYMNYVHTHTRMGGDSELSDLVDNTREISASPTAEGDGDLGMPELGAALRQLNGAVLFACVLR